MLLPSHRHTAADLTLWADLEAADLLHFVSARVNSKAVAAVECIRTFVAAGACYTSVSWGKDSTVLAHLVHEAACGQCLANVAQHGIGYDPHIPDVRDAFLKIWPMRYVEETVPLESISDNGHKSPALEIGIGKLAERFGTRRYIGGVRADESGARRVGFRTRGLWTANTCQPLGWWTAADVFAYLAHHQLPVHPNYAMLGGGRWDRDQVRVSTIGGPKGNQFGRREWEQEYYGDVLRRIEASTLSTSTKPHSPA